MSYTLTAQSTGLLSAPGNVGGVCTFTYAVNVTMAADLDEDSSGTVSNGHFTTTWVETALSQSCPTTNAAPGSFGPQTDDIAGQAVTNLHFSRTDSGPVPGGGTIAVTTSRAGAGDRIHVSVEDSGPGFPPEQLEPGSNGAGSRKPFGLGLGLRLCREIATEHGGRLELGRSDALGGARATIELPVDTIDAWPASS